MALPIPEFIRRFLLHVLPSRFHRIRHYGLLANGGRAENLARAHELLQVPAPQDKPDPDTETDDPGTNAGQTLKQPCPCCSGRMIIIETFEAGYTPRGYAARAPPRPGKGERPKGEHR